MKYLLLLLCCGCVVSRSHLTETTPEGVKRDLQLNNFATLGTTQSIDKQRASIGKTLSAGNIMLDQQANGTNFVEALKAIRDILQLIR